MNKLKPQDLTQNLAIIILAAGSSSRLGKPKQLLVYQNETLIKRIVKTALKIHQKNIFVVTGFLQQELNLELQDLPIQLVYNPNWAEGMGSSIQTGIKYVVQNPKINAVLILLSDQPLINSLHLEQLIIKFYADKNSMIVATNYAETEGVPAIFDKTLFNNLLDLPANRGAQWLFETYHNQLATVTFEGATLDIDTLEDYKNLLNFSEKI